MAMMVMMLAKRTVNDNGDDLGETSKELQGLARNSTEVPPWAVSILSVSRTLWSLPTGELGCI